MASAVATVARRFAARAVQGSGSAIRCTGLVGGSRWTAARSLHTASSHVFALDTVASSSSSDKPKPAAAAAAAAAASAAGGSKKGKAAAGAGAGAGTAASTPASASSGPKAPVLDEHSYLTPDGVHAYKSHLNDGIPLDLAWVSRSSINKNAVDRRASEIPARRSVKKDWQLAWLLRGAVYLALSLSRSANASFLIMLLASPHPQPSLALT